MTQTLATTVSKIAEVPNQVNADLLYSWYEYMNNQGTSESYKTRNLKAGIYFARSLPHDVTLYDIKKPEPILKFLDSKIKTTNIDPEQKWIRTWNDYKDCVKFFFRWLYNVKLKSKKAEVPPLEQWRTPAFAKIPKKKQKRLSPYSISEIWDRDEWYFVTEYETNLRNKAALRMLWDFNARNHEVVLVKNKNIRFKESYGEGEVSDLAKTGARPILLRMSFTAVRDLINADPLKDDPEAYLIRNSMNGCKMKPEAIWKMAMVLRMRIESMLRTGAIKDEALREKLGHLLRIKKWNPYAIRHSSITDDSDYLPEFALRKKVGWSMNSRQPARYVKKKMGNQLTDTILAHDGIVTAQATRQKLTSVACPKCNHPNAINNDFCSRCSYPLTVKAYDEIKKMESETMADLKEIREFAAMVRDGKIMDLLRKGV